MLKHTLRLIVLTLAVVQALSAAAYSTSYYTSNSKLASGHWVRVEADTTGIFEISHEQLLQWGFQNPADVCVFGYGAVRSSDNTFSAAFPDDLPQTASMHTADKLIFYAEADSRAALGRHAEAAVFTRNYYDTKGVYFLSEEHPHEMLVDIPYAQADESVPLLDYSYCIDLVEREAQCVGEGGVIYHGPKLKPKSSESFDFHIYDFGNSGATRKRGYFKYEAAVNTPVATKMPITVSPNIWMTDSKVYQSGSNTIATKLFVSAYGEAHFMHIDARPLHNTLMTMTVSVPQDYVGSYIAIDKAYVIYPRYNKLHSFSEIFLNFLPLEGKSQNFKILEADSNVEIWNVVDPANIVRYEYRYDVEEQTATAALSGNSRTENTRVVAFNPEATHRSPRYAGVVQNQNLHGLKTPEMVIFTTDELYPAACELADIHRSQQGLDVIVLNQKEVFNEFSSGVQTPTALRRLVKMFYDRDPADIKYILLYGPSTWDNRHLVNPDEGFLVNYECENLEQARESSTNYAADQYFGMVGDDFSPVDIGHMPMQISVGRIPARDIATARQINKKVLEYLSEVPSAANYLRTLKISDDGDDRVHFDHSEQVYKAICDSDPAMTMTRADNLLYPWTNSRATEARKLVARTLARGVGLMYYTGHGSSSGLTAENLWNVNAIEHTLNSHYPLVILSSCDAFPFDRESSTLIESMVFKVGGGAMGAVGACRSVYLDHNRPLSLAIAKAYAAAKPCDSGADIFRAAREIMISQGMVGNLGFNTLCYNYCGDPALPLRIPTFGIECTEIAGVSDLSSPFEMPSMTPVQIKARVNDPEGNIVGNFNGRVLIEVYDSPETLSTFVRNSDDGKTTDVVCDHNLLAEYGAIASNGLIETTIVLPAPATPDVLNEDGTFEGLGKRIVITATDSTTLIMAAGALTTPRITAAPDDEPSFDTTAPRIIEFAIDPDAYISPEAVTTDFNVLATIDPSLCGISVGISGIRPGLQLTLDGKYRYAEAGGMLTYADDKLAHLSYPMQNLSQGRHELVLTITNNAGMLATSTIAFTVGTPSLEGKLTLDFAGPARSEATFTLSGASDADATLIITDARGNTVHRAPATFPYTWNLRDASGARVPDGRYSAHVLLASDIAFGASPALDFIVVE